jgi:ABC-type transport system involved in cytochrome c biogenesis permease subunit
LSGRAKAFVDSVTAAARARGEATRIGLEVGYHKTEYFYNALLYFFGALIIVALSWLAPRGFWGRWCVRISVALMVAGAAYSVVGIVIRCIIMQRPPVTSLYETILFITTAAVVFGLVTEWVMRKGIALAMACLAGTVGMFISLRFMNMETMTLGSTDTMKPLEAVLITTFWLATHVPTINLGYAAGMMAAILSMFYFLVRLLVLARVLRADRAGAPAAIVGHGIGFLSRLGKPKDAPGRELLKIRDINRIAYAFVCAGLFLSLVGTVLGGIWANYSWGRFWGWDPKENGALMIVLMNLVILHARVGGYIREVGFHACNIILGMITVFSWFGTNQLGIGLHSYGTLTGVWWWIYAFWASQLGVLAFAALLAFLDRSAGAGKEGHAVEPRVAGGSVQAG